MVKVVLDTSVFIAALLSKNTDSSPSQILLLWRSGAFLLVMSPQILGEIVEKLIEREIPEETIAELLEVIDEIALNIPGAFEATYLDSIDPDDNMFLASAYESHADYLVSLDKKHILPIKHYHGTQIVCPEIFLGLYCKNL